MPDSPAVKRCRNGRHILGAGETKCRECRLENGRRCAKKWRLANPEKQAANLKKWHEENRGRHRALQKAWQKRNPDYLKSYARKYREENRERVREYDRDWRAKNRERALAKAREAQRKRYAANPEVKKLRVQQRRYALGAAGPGVTPAEWLAVCDSYRDANGCVCCAYCKAPCKPTVDHVVPLVRGGRDEVSNVVPACKSCNCSKSARLLSERSGNRSRTRQAA
jgi:5-methylcytosine-specific restriction endonuclease McrA